MCVVTRVNMLWSVCATVAAIVLPLALKWNCRRGRVVRFVVPETAKPFENHVLGCTR